jgi:hypothetical protein
MAVNQAEPKLQEDQAQGKGWVMAVAQTPQHM